MKTDSTRIATLNDKPLNSRGDCVIYWMQKDQRPTDNWALLRAAEIANEHDVPLVVAFFVWEKMHNAYVRHYDFMLRGLKETATALRGAHAGFVMRHDAPATGIVRLAEELRAVAVVTDQSYLALGRRRRESAATHLAIRLEAVDANLIVPPRVAADKALYGAYILRPKLDRLMGMYLTDYPVLKLKQPWSGVLDGLDDQNVEAVLAQLRLDDSVPAVKRAAGPEAAADILRRFMKGGLQAYQGTRNDPAANSTSQLSAYLHYGQISAQRVAYDLVNSQQYGGSEREAIDGYLDELITWRELSTNFCLFNGAYTGTAVLPNWAQQTLSQHENDEREFLYSRSELEAGETHDELWNAAQLEMVRSGRMHGYMRMYWGKKILEWTPDAATALDYAVYLNDKYELDGREPGGYTGILWAIGGLHDRPWFERDIFGKIRYMSYNGAKGKFKIADYVAWVNSLA